MISFVWFQSAVFVVVKLLVTNCRGEHLFANIKSNPEENIHFSSTCRQGRRHSEAHALTPVFNNDNWRWISWVLTIILKVISYFQLYVIYS